MHPLFLMTSFKLGFHQTSELAPIYGPPGPIALALSDFQYEGSTFTVEGMNVNPHRLIQDLLNSPQCIVIPLLVIEAALWAPVTLTGPRSMLLDCSGTYCDDRRIVAVSFQLFIR